MLKSLHFAKEKDIHAYNFPQGLSSTPDFSESEAGEDSAISREWTPLPDFEDSEIQTTFHDDASILEDDVLHGKPQQWTEYSESGDAENCTTPQRSASDLEDKALSSELRQLSPVHQIRREIDDEIPDDESLNADSPESRELFTIYECDERFDDDQQDDKPMKANSPEPLQLSPMNPYHTDFDDDQQDSGSPQIESPESRQFFPSRHESPIPEFDDYEEDDMSLEKDSPEPRRLFPVNQLHSALCNPPQPDLQTETWCPAPLRRFLTPGGILELDLFEDWFLYMSEGASIDANPEKYTSKTSSPEPGNKLFPLGEESPVPENDSDEKDDEPLEADSPEPRRIFPVHQFHSAQYDPPQLAPQMGILCPIPIRQYASHKVILQPELFEDWFVDMSEPIFIDEEAISPDKSVSGTPSPESQKIIHVRHESPYAEVDDKPQDDEALEAFEIIPLESLNLGCWVHQPTQRAELQHDRIARKDGIFFWWSDKEDMVRLLGNEERA